MNRTEKQNIANRHDLEIFNLQCALERSFEKTKDKRFDDAALALHRSRLSLRPMMHPKDIEATS